MKCFQHIRYALGIMLVVLPTMLISRDTILEFKGAYFLPTNHTFKDIFHNGGALYGPELTVQLCDDKPWYAFASIDYFQKKGRSIGLSDRTKVSLLPLAIGIKYVVPLLCDCVDLYAGLGFQAERVHTKNDSPFVIPELTRWGFGGIAKIGTYCYLPHNFVIDFFIDYSFVQTHRGNDAQAPTGPIVPLKAHVSGAIFGIGLGYVF